MNEAAVWDHTSMKPLFFVQNEKDFHVPFLLSFSSQYTKLRNKALWRFSPRGRQKAISNNKGVLK